MCRPVFNADHALTMQLSLSRQKYPDDARRAALYRRVTDSVAALPGVEVVGLTESLPMRGLSAVFFRIVGRKEQPEQGYDIDVDFCTADYIRAIGIPLQRAGNFTASEGRERGACSDHQCHVCP